MEPIVFKSKLYFFQAASWGHDSYEDARACVELMLWKVRKDLPIFGAKLKDYDEFAEENATVFFTDYGNIDQLGIWIYYLTSAGIGENLNFKELFIFPKAS